MIVIINYGLGNLRSILKKFERIKIDAIVSSDPKIIQMADKLILPGVGHFAQGIKNIREMGISDLLHQKVIRDKTPILGICLGLQLFAKHGQEGACDGLGWLDAQVLRFDFPPQSPLRVPHVGWNTVNFQKQTPLLKNIPNHTRFYFTHSYYFKANQRADVVATTDHGFNFDSVVQHGHIYGTQFHPEKSHLLGLEIFRNFTAL